MVLEFLRIFLYDAHFRAYNSREDCNLSFSAETVHLILLRYFGDAIRCAVTDELKIFGRNRPML